MKSVLEVKMLLGFFYYYYYVFKKTQHGLFNFRMTEMMNSQARDRGDKIISLRKIKNFLFFKNIFWENKGNHKRIS